MFGHRQILVNTIVFGSGPTELSIAMQCDASAHDRAPIDIASPRYFGRCPGNATVGAVDGRSVAVGILGIRDLISPLEPGRWRCRPRPSRTGRRRPGTFPGSNDEVQVAPPSVVTDETYWTP